MNKPWLLIVPLLGCGCSLQERVGDYVTKAALDSVERKLETAVSARGVDYAELKALFLADKAGQVSPTSILDNAKEFSRGLISSEGAKLQALLIEKITDYAARESGRTREDIEALRKKMDQDNSGDVSREEFTREMKSQLAILGAGIKDDSSALISRTIDDVKRGALSGDQLKAELAQYKDDFKGRMQEFWYSLIAGIASLLTAYAGKQVFSAKGKAQTQARLELLEKLTGINLSGGSTPPTPPAVSSQPNSGDAAA